MAFATWLSAIRRAPVEKRWFEDNEEFEVFGLRSYLIGSVAIGLFAPSDSGRRSPAIAN